jgi:hypothetical protein
MNEPTSMRARPILTLGIALGAILAGGLALLGSAVSPSPTMRVPTHAVLRGHVPDALHYAATEAARLRGAPDAWPPAPLRLPGRAPVADEGVFHVLPGAAPVATTWLHLPGDTDATVHITAWPSARVHLAAAPTSRLEALAWVPSFPVGAPVDDAIRALGASPAAAPRGSDAADDDAVALCRTRSGTAMLLRGRAADTAPLEALIRHLACDAPGAVWRAADGGMRVRVGQPPPGLSAWVLTAAPVDTSSGIGDDEAPASKDLAGGPWTRNASISWTEAPTSSVPSSRSAR